MPADLILFGLGSAARRFISRLDANACRIIAVSDFTWNEAKEGGFYGHRYVPAKDLGCLPFQWLIIASGSYGLISEYLIHSGIPKEKIVPFCIDPLDTDWNLPAILTILASILVAEGDETDETSGRPVLPPGLRTRLSERSRGYTCGLDGLKMVSSVSEWLEVAQDAPGLDSRELVAIPAVGSLVDSAIRLNRLDGWRILDVVFERRTPGSAVCLAGKLSGHWIIHGRNRHLVRRGELRFCGEPSVSYCELLEWFVEKFPVLDLRHDVDHDLRHAMKTALIEREAGISATYYLLHPVTTMNYYGRVNDGKIEHSRMLLEYADRLTQMGHRVGLHHALVEFSAVHHCDPGDILETELNWFRQRDVPVERVSTHGTKHAYQHGYIDYEVFKECNPSRHETWGEPSRVVCGVALNSVSLTDLGCREAYFDQFDYYFSDSHGKSIMGYRVDGVTGFEPQVRRRQRDIEHAPFHSINCEVSVYPEIMPDEGGSCQLLVHPFWWRW